MFSSLRLAFNSLQCRKSVRVWKKIEVNSFPDVSEISFTRQSAAFADSDSLFTPSSYDFQHLINSPKVQVQLQLESSNFARIRIQTFDSHSHESNRFHDPLLIFNPTTEIRIYFVLCHSPKTVKMLTFRVFNLSPVACVVGKLICAPSNPLVAFFMLHFILKSAQKASRSFRITQVNSFL
jgi:hypothetical protein